MIKKLYSKFKQKYFYYRNFAKYLNNKNIIIKKQNRLNDIGNIEFSKKSLIKIGDDFKFRKNFSLRCRENAKLVIGDRVYFNNNCIITCRKKIVIGNDVSFGPNVILFDHDHNYKAENRKTTFICDEITIGDNSWIGGNVSILKGSHIGKNVVIAAGAVVKGDIPDNTIYYDKETSKKIEGIKNE